MKKIKFYLATLLCSALLLSSCSESFFDINVSPNNPAAATPALVLPSAISGSAYVLGGYYHTVGSFWTQQYAQSSSSTQWAEWESYNLTEDDFNRQFTTLYAGSLYDYQYVRDNAAASANWKYYSISTLMQAYTFQVLADLYDKIPFKEALKGIANTQPHYDNGAEVYDSLLVRINNAMTKDFNASTVENPAKSDLVFAGDMDNWSRFANTLKLKIYMRYTKTDPNKYKTQILALLADNKFLTVDAKFSAFKAEQTGYNPYYNTFVDRLASNVIANTTLMSFLNTNADPRQTKIFKASETGALMTSLVSGDSPTSTGTSKNYATPNISGTEPVYFFTKAQVLFLIAEAQERYVNSATAQITYNSAISESCISLGLAANAIPTTMYPYNGLKSIMEQKWLAASNKCAIEAFFDFNRTGYPDFFTKSKTTIFNGNERPQRLFFPDSERKANPNTPAKVAITEKVWWAK